MSPRICRPASALVLAVSLPAGMAVGDGLVELERLWADKAQAVETRG